MDIENKTIIITGAARGLGAAMAKRLATHKCKLGLIDLEQESMNDIKEACEAVGAEVMTYAADVTREEDVVCNIQARLLPILVHCMEQLTMPGLPVTDFWSNSRTANLRKKCPLKIGRQSSMSI